MRNPFLSLLSLSTSFQIQIVQRAAGVPYLPAADVGVDARRLQPRMPQQLLDVANGRLPSKSQLDPQGERGRTSLLGQSALWIGQGLD